jgi:hypothetical protein
MSTKTTFEYTGTVQTFTVPDQVTSITAELYGGDTLFAPNGVAGGYVKATFPVTPGQTLYVYVGGQGKIGQANSVGGWNGGGKAGNTHSGAYGGISGGGASDIRIGGTALSNRVLVAGGAGGVGQYTNPNYNKNPALGGKGGANTGQAGDKASAAGGGLQSTAAGGGTQAAGGAGGAGQAGNNGTAGALGVGGAGWNATGDQVPGGGGGGGGYYGGGGGGRGIVDQVSAGGAHTQGGGGGGGSNFIAATINGSAPTATQTLQGVSLTSAGGPKIFLTYDAKPVVSTSSPDTKHTVPTTPVGNFTFQAVYTDDNGAAPASYQIVLENNVTGAVLFDSGQVTVTSSNYSVRTTGSYYLNVPLNLSTLGATANTNYRWKVRAWDTAGKVSDYAAYASFNYAAPPSFSITPANGAAVGNGKPTVDWSGVVFSLSATQASYRVRFIRVSDSVLMHDSKVTVSQATSYTPAQDILPNGVSYTIEVTINDTQGLSTVNTVTVTTSYTPPAPFNYSVDISTVDTLGYVLIDWSSAQADSSWVSWKVYRKLQDDADWTLILETFDIGVHQYYDYLVEAGVVYQYTVTQTSIVSGTIVESVAGMLSGGVVDTAIYPMLITQYWIIDPTNPDLSTVIPNVTSAPLAVDYEEESYTLIGRGRKKDYGTRLGYSGTLTAQAWGTGGVPTIIRTKLELMKAQQDEYWLRTPFGDLFMISLGQLEFDPVAGVGPNAMYDMTIAFEEIAGTPVEESESMTLVVTYRLADATLVDNGDGTSTLTLE